MLFQLSDCLVPYKNNTNICFDCQKACGGCSWSEIDPDTEKPRFQPVEGWTAEPVMMFLYEGKRIQTYHITACPEFVKDEHREPMYGELTEEQFAALMSRWRKRGEL